MTIEPAGGVPGASPPVALGGPLDRSTEDPNRGLAIRNLSKTFPGVRALRSVDLRIRGGSVHALLGHNGCGKSTLVKSLAGFHAPDDGYDASLDGRPLELGSAEAAERAGIRFVHQELGLIQELGPADNIGLALGYEKGPFGSIGWRRQERITKGLLDRFSVDIDLRRPLAEATPVARTAVAIVRAVAGWQLHAPLEGGGLLVLDEPTASLPGREVEQLFRLIREVRDSGTAVLLISHRLDEVMSIADHATVMRSGEVIFDGSTAEMSVRSFATLIAGSEVEAIEEAKASTDEDTFAGASDVLSVQGLSAQFLRGLDLHVREGEIVGVAGLLGSGREEVPYVVAGAKTYGVEGTFTVDGTTVTSMDLRTSRRLGIALVPADRGRESVLGDFNVRENVSVVALPTLTSGPTLVPSRERDFARTWLGAMDADPDVSERPITTLSGGNQQKAVLARWLSIGPRLLTLSEPTAGIDIGARTKIYDELRARAADGLAVLMSSSDAEDLVACCDRVIVLRDGVISAELVGPKLNKSAIVAAMEGVPDEQD